MYRNVAEKNLYSQNEILSFITFGMALDIIKLSFWILLGWIFRSTELKFYGICRSGFLVSLYMCMFAAKIMPLAMAWYRRENVFRHVSFSLYVYVRLTIKKNYLYI